MGDPLLDLVPVFQDALARAFGREHAAHDPLLRRSDHADLQANVALALRGAVPGAPRQLAEAIVRHLDTGDRIARIEIAGPGFINVTLTAEYLADGLARMAASSLGIAPAAAPETVVVDYSSPNVAKEMHVGHLRSTIIGDALVRVLEAIGHRVVRQNHLGDWGTPFGMLIEHLIDVGDDAREPSMEDLVSHYRAARVRFDEDPVFAERARARVVALQAGDADTLARWQRLVDATRHYCAAVYALLGVTLTDADVAGESLYNPMLAPVVEALQAEGVAVESEGALCVFAKGFTGRGGEPVPLIVRKQDGGYGYATTDLAALRYRLDQLRATRLVYVVGSPQAQHLAMVFATAAEAGWLVPPARAEHVAFGSILGADGKMFRTRAGESVRLLDLLHEAVERARAVVEEKNPGLPEAERAAVARAVGIGAVKYADLSSDRIKDYVFDWGRMLALEGNTAPYLQYAHARIRSIFRRGSADVPPPSAIRVGAPAERALALVLLRFPTTVGDVARALEPHRLCTYLYELATAFSTFYEACPVLRAPTAEERASRLALSDLTARVLARGLDLLGIEAPDRI